MKLTLSSANARLIVGTLTDTPSLSRSSVRVASGCSSSSPRSRSAWARSAGSRGLRQGRGATSPLSRRRCLSRLTHEPLTRYFWAPAFVPAPASQSSKTRVLRSIE